MAKSPTTGKAEKPLKAGATHRTPGGDKPAPKANDTLTEESPLKDTGTSADGVGGTHGAGSAGSASWRDEATRYAKEAGERAKSFADEGKTRATEALEEFSKMMTDAAGTVDEKLGEDYGKYARSAADSLAGFAETLKGKQVDDLLSDAADLVRKSPAVAIGTAAALGFVLARLLKSGVDAAGEFADTVHDKTKV